MSNRYIAAYGEIHCSEEDNEWLPHKDFTKAKTPIQIELWSFDKKKDMQLIYRNFN